MATAVCDPLWGSTPIITLTASSSIAFDEAAVGTPDYGSLCGRTSFEPHLGEIPASQQLVRKPDGQADNRHIEANPPGPQTLRINRAVALKTQPGTYAVGTPDTQNAGPVLPP